MPSGEFAVPGPNTPGNYDLSVKPLSMLRRTVSIDTSAGGASGVGLALTNGDIDGDNEVAIGDYSVLSSVYGTSEGDPNWDASADLNDDLAVDIGDYSVLSANYGTIGDD